VANVAIIEAKPSRNDYTMLFKDAFEFDQFSLTSNRDIKKVLKKDVDIDIDIDEYEWIILVGSEAFKYCTKMTSITQYTGQVVDEKFLPVINPAMISFKPEAKRPWEESRDKIIKYVTGELQKVTYSKTDFTGIETKELAMEYLQAAYDHPNTFITLDSETSNLYPRNGYMMGFSLTYKADKGAYILTDCIDDDVEQLMQAIFDKKLVVFHNAKFDLAWFEYHFGFNFPHFGDTMLMHYTLDETQGTHGLKALALKFTKYGDYEKAQNVWIDDYCKKNRIKKADFTYDLIPFEIINVYAAIDTAVTFELYIKFKSYLDKNVRLTSVYENILIPGCRFLTDIQEHGVPFDKERLKFGQATMAAQIAVAVEKLHSFPEIAQFEKTEEKDFNPNSTVQLRKLLFDYIGLKPTGKLTGKGAHSTDAEVLEKLAEIHEIPEYILNLRKSSKIKNTYLDKIIPQLDRDQRLRTNFNLSSTTSGRLSSSGKLNMQQLPRDNPAVKGCIKARPGHKIVAMDLTTAEMYIAAVVSDDIALQDVFRSGGNFHSQIAKKVFGLDCDAEDVAELFPALRQAAKAISFGILYGASARKIAETVNKEMETAAKEKGVPFNRSQLLSTSQAQGTINEYFSTFWKLKEWIDATRNFIKNNAYVYSPLGRKRRLPNVRSDNSGVQGHEIRSGLNFIIQSTASDANLLGAIDTHAWLKVNKFKAKIFALVHDSILAEVPDAEVDEYKAKLLEFVQLDRGVSIPGVPIGCDFDVADEYALGKFEKVYGEAFDEWKEAV
jgi:DNA polymerase I-like protein with 3'-5' exonuclease and polymerase domains